MRRVVSVLAVLAASLAASAPALGAVAYPIYGDGDQPLRAGVLASDADIRSGPSGVAVRDDGVVAFVSLGAVYSVERELVQRVPVPAYDDLGLAFARDGTLPVASCSGLFSDMIGTEALRVSAAADGALYTVDFADDDGTVKRIVADGTLSVVTRLRRDRIGISPFSSSPAIRSAATRWRRTTPHRRRTAAC